MGCEPSGTIPNEEPWCPIPVKLAAHMHLKPLPRNMNVQRYPGRRKARADYYARRYQNHEDVLYVDAAVGPLEGTATVAAMTEDGRINISASVKTARTDVAEGVALALAVAHAAADSTITEICTDSQTLPEFRGFQDDPAQRLKIADSLGNRHGWSDGVKRSYAEGRLRGAAEAWNRYNGHTYRSWREWSEALLTVFGRLTSSYEDRFMQMRARRQGPSEDVVVYIYDKLRLLRACILTWPSPTARQYVLDGLPDPIHGAILAAQPLDTTAEVFFS
ncbi:hypothetical protein HPB49_017183 [Dermacentor silvarum]|uniref:Uncharacterized protein n=1 Tax=Dermacentor silvarum TaxID=543639 RepID=A0ACB8DK39_DERSI|nr:hypothetical protein HPB49_017183 [Dermacentor silvarum]